MNLPVDPEGKRKAADLCDDGGIKVRIIDDAGHHLYFGNPSQLSEVILEESLSGSQDEES